MKSRENLIDEEEGEEFLPSRGMARWLQDKPAGFGEGKKYDTTVEEKLMEEVERSRKAQLKKKKKTGAKAKENTGSDNKQEKQKAVDVIQIRPQVRIWNLPKKKNIDRDLWKAFKEFPGIMAVNPAVTGNQKTRDPICKGFAFIVLKSDDAAYRFVQYYSKQNLLFGRVQKEIYCDLVDANQSIKSPESNKHTISTNLQEVGISTPYELEASENFITIPQDEQETQELALGNWSTSCSGFPKGGNEITQPLIPMTKQQNPEKMVKKRKKDNQRKASKLQTIGSLARLKVKERAVLTNVFSKYTYGEIASIESKES
ncbi:hypothetical protein HPP92_005544 [Vanilla planifolia]|uniref:RRM domain-containing protein n=1 Tax=Vanilla planifolia TaxID=51239 RepID=A0A835RU90_VANPL|nr:hypothetical protein HPP92_005544 [Vanilla planifolia]